MQTHYANRNDDPAIERVLRAIGYTGRKPVRLRAAESVPLSGTYWDGGSRTSYYVANLGTGEARALPHFDPPQFGGPQKTPIQEIPADKPGAAIVALSTFCGREMGPTIYVRPESLAPLLPERVELSEAERRVLVLTASLNSRGRKDWREKAGVPKAAWDAVVATLAPRGLMTARGAITPDGRNAVAGQREDYSWRSLDGQKGGE